MVAKQNGHDWGAGTRRIKNLTVKSGIFQSAERCNGTGTRFAFGRDMNEKESEELKLKEKKSPLTGGSALF